MKIIFAGTPEFAAVALRALLKTHHEIIAVYTQPDRPSGRGRKLTPSDVKNAATEANIPVYQPQSLKETEDQRILADLGADLMIVAAYGLILPSVVLNTPKLGCVNIHASLLPRWRGAAPIHRAIQTGDQQTGITIMQMDEGLDTGGMLLKKTCAIEDNDTSASLHDRLALLGGEVIVESLAGIEAQSLEVVAQDNALANYAHKLKKAESNIDWTLSAKQINNQIRAFNPWPVAQCDFEGKVLRLWMSELPVTEHSTSEASEYEQKPGTIISATKKGLGIVTGEGILRVTSVQLSGGKAMDVINFVNANDLVSKQLN